MYFSPKVITITNEKGGVGKTTITHNLGASLARDGYRVLLIDFDTMANLSLSVGHSPNYFIDHIIATGKTVTKHECCKTYLDKLFIIPNNGNLDYLDNSNAEEKDKIFRLEKILEDQIDFDFILIDTPGSINSATITTFICADYILIPIEPSIFSTSALNIVMQSYNLIKELNGSVEILGIFFNRVDNNEKIFKDVREGLLQSPLGEYIMKTHVRKLTRFKDAQNYMTDIYNLEAMLKKDNLVYDKSGINKAIEDINNLKNEILKTVL